MSPVLSIRSSFLRVRDSAADNGAPCMASSVNEGGSVDNRGSPTSGCRPSIALWRHDFVDSRRDRHTR